MDKIFFAEKQKLYQKWIWAVLIAVNLVFVIGIIIQIGLGVPFGNNPASDGGLILSAVLVAFITLFNASFRLETKVSSSGFYFRYLPLIWSYRVYRWDEIKEIKVREYDPMNTFFGWGLRWNFWSYKGWCYSIAGEMAVEVILKSGKKFMVGTQKPHELKVALGQSKAPTTES